MSDTTTTREPLLSDDQFESWADLGEPLYNMRRVRDWYEARITSGELRVVKTARNVSHEFECSACGFALFDATQNPPVSDKFNFCPGCGAKIVGR